MDNSNERHPVLQAIDDVIAKKLCFTRFYRWFVPAYFDDYSELIVNEVRGVVDCFLLGDYDKEEAIIKLQQIKERHEEVGAVAEGQ